MKTNIASSFSTKAKKALRFVLFFVALIISLSLVSSIRVFLSASSRLDESNQKLQNIKKENEELQEQLEEVASDFYTEKSAREKLNYAYDNEVVVVLPEEDIIRLASPYKQKEKKVVLPDPNWKKWVQLFLY